VLTSAISEWEAGLQPASPNPTPSRANARGTKLVAKPLSAVKALQSASETVMINGRLRLSASQAIGMPRKQ